MAALDIGFGLLAGLVFRAGCFVAGTLVALSAVPGDVTQDSIWADDGWLSRSGGTATAVVEETESTLATDTLQVVSGQRLMVEIESVQLGARIGTRNPRPWENDYTFPDPVREDWIKLSITVERSDGGVVDLEVLRPRVWVEQQGIAAGSLLPLNVEELEVDGLAFVHAVEPCPEIASGPGNVVTGRFVTRQVNTIARVEIEGPDGRIEILEGTLIHPIWSVDREDWIPLGELIEGESLQAADGPAVVRSITLLTVAIPVYNMEVHGVHVYQVGEFSILVHNSGGIDCNAIGRLGERLGLDKLKAKGWTPIASLTHGRNGLDVIAQKVIRGNLRTIIVEIKANGGQLSRLQRLGAEGYAMNVIGRFKRLNLSPEARQALNLLQSTMESGTLRGIMMRFDWRSGDMVEKTLRWLPS